MTNEQRCGNCRYLSKVSEFGGNMVGYCIALGTDSNNVMSPPCLRWNKRDGTEYNERGELVPIREE